MHASLFHSIRSISSSQERYPPFLTIHRAPKFPREARRTRWEITLTKARRQAPLRARPRLLARRGDIVAGGGHTAARSRATRTVQLLDAIASSNSARCSSPPSASSRRGLGLNYDPRSGTLANTLRRLTLCPIRSPEAHSCHCRLSPRIAGNLTISGRERPMMLRGYADEGPVLLSCAFKRGSKIGRNFFFSHFDPFFFLSPIVVAKFRSRRGCLLAPIYVEARRAEKRNGTGSRVSRISLIADIRNARRTVGSRSRPKAPLFIPRTLRHRRATVGPRNLDETTATTTTSSAATRTRINATPVP